MYIDFNNFYRAMLKEREDATVRRLPLRPSVCDVPICFPHTGWKFEYFENNFKTE